MARQHVRTYTASDRTDADCTYCQQGACVQRVEEYGPDPDVPGDDGADVVIHEAVN